MRRSVLIMVCVFLCISFSLFAGGKGEGEQAASASTKVTVWGWWEPRMQLFTDAGAAFSEQNPGITVEVTTIPDDTLWQKAIPAFASGNGPSLILADSGKYYEFLQRGLIDPYSDEYFPGSWVEANFPEAPWDQGLEKDGRFYNFPGGYSPDIFVYNKRLFAEAGLDPDNPPRTWEELVEAAKKLTKRDSQGNLLQAGYQRGDEYFLLTYVYQTGGDIVSAKADGSVTASMTTPEVTKAFQFIVDLHDRYKVTSYDLPEVQISLGEEKAAMAIVSSWVVGDIEANHPDVFANLGFSTPPTPTGETRPYTGRKDPVLLLMVNANRPEAEKAAAQQYLKFIYKDSDTFLHNYARLLGIAPSKKSLFSDPDILASPPMSAMLTNLEFQKGPLAVTDDLTTVFKNALERVILTDVGVEDSLITANKELNMLINDQPNLYRFLK